MCKYNKTVKEKISFVKNFLKKGYDTFTILFINILI